MFGSTKRVHLQGKKTNLGDGRCYPLVERLAEHYAEDLARNPESVSDQLLAVGITVEGLENASQDEVKDVVLSVIMSSYEAKKNELSNVDPELDKKVCFE